jgi:hypothetical protein
VLAAADGEQKVNNRRTKDTHGEQKVKNGVPPKVDDGVFG